MASKLRPLPSNPHSERLVLGELLMNNACWEQAQVLTAGDFSLTSHKRIFACIASRLSRKRPIDTILLIDAMRRQKELAEVGGEAYLSDLTSDSSPHLLEHLRLLREKCRLRLLLECLYDAQEATYSESESSGVAESTLKRLASLPVTL